MTGCKEKLKKSKTPHLADGKVLVAEKGGKKERFGLKYNSPLTVYLGTMTGVPGGDPNHPFRGLHLICKNCFLSNMTG